MKCNHVKFCSYGCRLYELISLLHTVLNLHQTQFSLWIDLLSFLVLSCTLTVIIFGTTSTSIKNIDLWTKLKILTCQEWWTSLVYLQNRQFNILISLQSREKNVINKFNNVDPKDMEHWKSNFNETMKYTLLLCRQ